MTHETLTLTPDPGAALATLRELSSEAPTLVFKASPICPVSLRAEGNFERWLADFQGGAGLKTARIDVIAQRELARGLTAELGIQHQSPQLLWFEGGQLRWHGSHGELTVERFEQLYGER